MLIDYVRVTPYTESLFTNQVPASILNTDGPRADYELGTLFQSSASGRISALRFWKESIETGIHTGGHIWDPSGALLTSVAFLGETARGWQQQNLATPLPIVANTEYLASVNTGNTYYVATARGFATPIINGHLSSIVGGNARYGLPGQYLAQTFNANNYFRDLVFVVGGYDVFPSEEPVGQCNGGIRYELATQFHSSQAGHITAFRFYKPLSGNGDYVMHLWNGSGNLVAKQDMGSTSAEKALVLP